MQMDNGYMKEIKYENFSDYTMAEKNPNLVFHIGEIVQVKDGEFKIKSFGNKMIVLEGIPGTRIKKK